MILHRVQTGARSRSLAGESLAPGTAAIALVLGSLVPLPAQAQPGDASARQEEPAPAPRTGEAVPADDLHSRQVDFQGEIIVTATGLAQLDVLAGTSVFEAEEIQQNLAPQLGDVLAKLPGVSASGFSPGASRPILRGFQGERVRVLSDGLGTLDVSNTSADHATTIESLTAERIEVLRGPAVLLYGSQAIGGAVNVIDKRIPRRLPVEPVHLDALLSANTAYDLREGAGSLDAPIGSGLAIHADGSYRETSDMETGGALLAPPLRANLLARAADAEIAGQADLARQLRGAADARDVLSGSNTRTWSANAGFAHVDEDNMLGAAIGWYDTRYGVPTRPGGEEAQQVSIALEQFRADLRAELALGQGFFQRMITRIGYSDYRHSEIEGEETGTTFDVEGVEARLELEQARRGSWGGSLGAQYFFRDFLAEGEEAYIAPNTTEQFSLFALQEWELGVVEAELAGRVEWTQVGSQALGAMRDFTTFSGAFGLAHEPLDGLRIGVNLSRSQRAPSAEEMFSNGAHLATQAFEIGNLDLAPETALGIEAYARGRLGPAQLSIAAYRSRFDDYIYLDATGLIEEGLPVFRYLQRDARYTGFEGEVMLDLHEGAQWDWRLDLRADHVRASLDDGTPLPRIPPLSVLGAIEARSDALDLRAELQWFARQDRLAPLETPTDDYALVNLALTYRPLRARDSVTVVAGIENLFDSVGRNHASFTKDFVPIAGRNAKVSLRLSF